MSEDVAYQNFLLLRWPKTLGKPVCPFCSSEKAYHISTRRKFKCGTCLRQYSATTNTPLASRKLPFSILIKLISGNWLNPYNASQRLDINYRTAVKNKNRTTFIGGIKYSGGSEASALTWYYPYSYVRSPKKIDWYDNLISLVPKGIPDWIRADICQDLALGILERREAFSDAKRTAKKAIQKNLSFYDMCYRQISLFTPVGDDGSELIDMISTEQYAEAFR